MLKTISALRVNTQLIALGALAALMLTTRTDFFVLGTLVPDASWSVFLLGGFYLARLRYFAALAVLAWVIDLAVVSQTPAAGYCLSPAYMALVASWMLLWSAGHLAQKTMNSATSLRLPLAGGLVLMAVSAAFALSNAGFYAWSGYFSEMSLAEYVSRVSQYFAFYLATSSIYFALGVMAPAAVARSRRVFASHKI